MSAATITFARGARQSARPASGDALVVARALDGRLLAKRHTRQPDGSIATAPYDRAYQIAVAEIAIDGLLRMADPLGFISRDPRRCVLRGRPLPGIDRARCRRLYLPHVEEDGTVTPPSFEPAARRWLALDLDSLPCPQWNPDDLAQRGAAIARDRLEHPIHSLPPKGPDDGADYDRDADRDPAPIDPVADWALVIRAAVSTLPPEFADAHCWWQMTSSAGIKPGVHLRLWYWLDRPVSDAEAKRWLADSPVDRSLFSPVQPHYTAAPIFTPSSLDPVPVRSGLWWRHIAAVPVPELPEPAPPPAPPAPVERKPPAIDGDHREIARQCLERSDLTAWERELCAKVAVLDTLTPKQAEALAKIADPEPAKAEAYAKAALAGVATATAGNRHPTLLAAGVRLFSLADAGLLDHADLTYRLLAAAEKPLTAAERQQRCARHGGRPSANEEAIDWARARARSTPDLPEGFQK